MNYFPFGSFAFFVYMFVCLLEFNRKLHLNKHLSKLMRVSIHWSWDVGTVTTTPIIVHWRGRRLGGFEFTQKFHFPYYCQMECAWARCNFIFESKTKKRYYLWTSEPLESSFRRCNGLWYLQLIKSNRHIFIKCRRFISLSRLYCYHHRCIFPTTECN